MSEHTNRTGKVTFWDRVRCYVVGHDVQAWGTPCGWCHRCEHLVLRGDGRTVFSGGLFYRFPPAHRARGVQDKRQETG